MLASNNTSYNYRFNLIEAGRELVNVAQGDNWSTSFLGSYQVEILTMDDSQTDTLVEFRVHNRTGWSSATRVWSRSFKEDEERWLPGPGGNLEQTYIWQERLPK